MTAPAAVIATSQTVDSLCSLLADRQFVVVADDPAEIDDAILERLEAAVTDGVGSVSPVPVASCVSVRSYAVHDAAPPAASVAIPCRRLCLLTSAAFASVRTLVPPATSIGSWIDGLGNVLLAHGWRSVVAPGVALAWDPTDVGELHSVGGWTEAAVNNLVGGANSGLEAHRSWASAQLDGLRVVIDGACLTADPYTGTQLLVTEIARWMSTTRPEATVMLAVRPGVAADVRASLDGVDVRVVTRNRHVDADVVYRPYQMLYAGELAFVTTTSRRMVVGQLDMIGFSNPFYHPSDQLFFFARNLQRHLMRVADGVTFISDYGRRSAFAECPDLEFERLHVVSCGTDPRPEPAELAARRGLDATTPFVACLSSTFWHKNRAHAIATFASLVERHQYDGHLLIGGPEPYFGRSMDAEDQILDGLDPQIAARVHRWGHISDAEKWWVLRHAQTVLYPSIVEGFGLVPFEAAAVGTPALAFAGTAQREMLGDSQATIDSWDPDAWADRVSGFLDDGERAAAVVEQIMTAAVARTWAHSAERTWTAIDHAVASPRRAGHRDDGAALARISRSGLSNVLAASLRFDAARGVPAIGRRVNRLRRQIRRSGAQ